MDDNSILDLIYGAAVEPHLWVPVMEGLVDLTGGNSAWLSRLNIANGQGDGLIARMDPEQVRRYQAHFGAINPFSTVPDPRSFMAGFTPRITVDEDWLPKADLQSSEYYNGFLAPQDVHSMMFVRLAAYDLDVCAVTLHRPRRAGGFEDRHRKLVERLHPHMIRAFRLGEQLSAAGLTPDHLSTAMDQSRFGVFILDNLGQMQRTNRAADRLLSEQLGLTALGGRLSAVGAAGKRLDALIAQAGARSGERAGGSMALAVREGRQPLSITVAPIQAERMAVFHHRPAIVVCVSDPGAAAATPQDRLRELFGLTRAEARVAAEILTGATSRQIAGTLGVSVHTVRNQLQCVLEKTGVSRQSELVMLLIRAVGLSAA